MIHCGSPWAGWRANERPAGSACQRSPRPALQRLAQGTKIDATELHRLTAGNPFFVTEVLQAGNEGLPASVRDAVLARTRTLSAPAREALDTAALIGSRMQSELLVSLIDNPLVTDELISHGLLIKDGDDLRFRHEIARVAIEGAIPPYRQAAMHTKIMEALLSSGSDDDARLAFHAEGAGNAELVLTYAPRAGRRAAALGARREAAAQYERALRFVPETDIRTRAELLDSLGEQLDFIDRWEDYAETRSEAAALWHELGDFGRESDSLLALAWGLWRQCRGADFRRTADAALKLAKPLGRSPQLANAYITLAYRHMIKSRYQDGLALLQHVREMSEQLGLGDVISDSLNVEARIVRAMGNDWTRPDASSAGDSAVRRPRVTEPATPSRTCTGCIASELRHEEAEQIYHEALAYCDVHDIGTSAEFLLGERAEVFEKLGRWDECLSIAHAMLDDQSLSPAGRLVPLTYQAKVMARRGQDGYWPYLDEALRYATGLEEPSGCSLCTWHALRRTGWRAVRMRQSRSWIASDMPLEASRQSSAVGWHCGHNDSPGLSTQLILSRSPHNSQGMVHGPSNSGIGSATAMRPHWRCWIRRRRPTCVSRCPGLLILVPKRQRAWCAALCAILASEEFLLVLVRQQRHTRAASPHASNRFSNSFPKVSPTRRSQPHCSFRSGPSNTTYPRFSANSACRRVRARPRRLDGWA